MDTRVAVISIIVEQEDAIEELNTLLHEARQYIVGRMGIPYRPKGISIISIAIDAPQDVISALSGKIGRLKGVSAKTAYSNVITPAAVCAFRFIIWLIEIPRSFHATPPFAAFSIAGWILSIVCANLASAVSPVSNSSQISRSFFF